MIKKEKAITLMALVITIIILLILAGISIAQLTGNGLFEKAKLSKEVSKNAQEDEEDKIKQYSNEINSYVGGNRESFIIASGDNSTQNSPATIWYVKYSNGLIQQWGKGSVESWANNTLKNIDINLPINYVTQNYSVTVNIDNCCDGWGSVNWFGKALSNTTVRLSFWNQAGYSVGSNTFTWYAIGY